MLQVRSLSAEQSVRHWLEAQSFGEHGAHTRSSMPLQVSFVYCPDGHPTEHGVQSKSWSPRQLPVM